MTLLWIAFAANGTAVAAITPSADPGQEIVVTGSRVATRADQIAANVTVLEREDFDVEKPADPRPTSCSASRACTWTQVGGRGGTGSLYLRGADPNYTLVLVDGVRVNDPTNARGGSFDFSALDVADIERVEMARGPYSAVYGGDALAGRHQYRHAPLVADRKPTARSTPWPAHTTRARSRCARAGHSAAAAGTWVSSDSNEGELVRGNRIRRRSACRATSTPSSAARPR